MGNGQGTVKVTVSVHPSQDPNVDPFDYDPWWHTSPWIIIDDHSIHERLVDPSDLSKRLSRLLYRLKVFNKEVAWDFVNTERSSIRLTYKNIKQRSLSGLKLTKDRDLRLKQHKQKPTYDRSQQYKPMMKGRSYGRGKR